MKKIKKIIVCLLVASFMLGNVEYESYAQKRSEKNIEFNLMSNEQLNEYIGQTMIKVNEIKNKNRVMALSMVQQAWLAAAQIARNNGYPCAASLVECSVNNLAYNEVTGVSTIGQCYKKIIKTSAYKKYIKKIKGKKQSSSGAIEFKKSMNADLYYALHNVDIKTKGYNVGKIGESHIITITDKFDFNKDNNYNDLFTTLVNNWAWLCQQTGALHKINVKITFTYVV